MFTIVVLNDGETYSDITGCKIMRITHEQHEALMSDTKASELSCESINIEGLI